MGGWKLVCDVLCVCVCVCVCVYDILSKSTTIMLTPNYSWASYINRFVCNFIIWKPSVFSHNLNIVRNAEVYLIDRKCC